MLLCAESMPRGTPREPISCFSTKMSQMRSLETGRYMLRATNTGLTAIIDERGHVRASVPEFVATSLHGTAQGFSGSTPYVRWGNLPFLVLAAAGLAGPLAWVRLRWSALH